MAEKTEDTSMTNVRAMFEKSGLSLQEIGVAMGYPAETARQSAFQFLKSSDPRISMLRRFADAVDVLLADLIAEHKKSQTERKTMNIASIMKHGKGTFTVAHDERIHIYDQGKGISDPPTINADFLWPKEAMAFHEVRFLGDQLPEVLIVRDGGAAGWHEYNRRK